MNWLEFLGKLFEACLVPLIGALVCYGINYLRNMTSKINNELIKKYSEKLLNIVETCVIATNQTYVSNLKKEDLFNEKAQVEAFNITKTAILNILDEETKTILKEAYGDINIYIEQLIEASIKNNK